MPAARKSFEPSRLARLRLIARALACLGSTTKTARIVTDETHRAIADEIRFRTPRRKAR